MKRKTLLVASIALLFVSLSVTSFRASFVPPLDLKDLTSKADVIAVGRVSQIEMEGPARLRSQFVSVPIQGHKYLGHLDIEKVLKGKVAGGVVSFRFALPDAPIGYRGIGIGQYGVFFFRAGAGSMKIVDPYHPFVVAAPGLGRATGSLTDEVVAEIAHVLSYSASTQDARVEAVLDLQAAYTPLATAYLKEAVKISDLRVRILVLNALLNRGDISVLPAVKSAAFSSAATDEGLMAGLGGALRGIRAPRAIPILNSLLRAPSVWVRRGAAAALRNTHDPKAIEPLTRALYDSDREVRYYGVVGLGEITGQDDWTPSIADFHQNEKRFVKHWREWARANGYSKPRS